MTCLSAYKHTNTLSEEDILRRSEVEAPVGAAVPAADVGVRAQPEEEVSQDSCATCPPVPAPHNGAGSPACILLWFSAAH